MVSKYKVYSENSNNIYDKAWHKKLFVAPLATHAKKG